MLITTFHPAAICQKLQKFCVAPGVAHLKTVVIYFNIRVYSIIANNFYYLKSEYQWILTRTITQLNDG